MPGPARRTGRGKTRGQLLRIFRNGPARVCAEVGRKSARSQSAGRYQEIVRGLIMLSVCFIARNEEKNLPRALASVRGIADEVIVADTGSTDRTVEIAKESGAIVCHFPWCDDFSAARNFAISHARGDWILWMDADEELLPESVNE